jgi:hypothetical protein
MLEVENDLKTINERITDLFAGASLIRFSYSGIYTLEFDLPREYCGYNYFYIDIGTKLSIFETIKSELLPTSFSIEDLLLIWSKTVTKAEVENDLSLSIIFDNFYCCRITSKLLDPENLFDMRWSIYQEKASPSFCVSVSDEENIFLQAP